MYAVGIDLGTTNSAVAVMKGRPTVVEDKNGNRTLPSALGWDPDFQELVIGRSAKENAEVFGTILSIKRLMGTDQRMQVGPRSMLPEEVSAEVLKVLKQQVEAKFNEKVTDAIITVPAYFQMAACAATKRAGELAGLNVQQLLAEPSAAVMAYGPQDDERILVFDLGGGTFDVTIMDHFAGTLTTLAVTGNNFLGGDDFDRRIMDHLVQILQREQNVRVDLEQDPVARMKLRQAAERAKIEMSEKSGARVEVPEVTRLDGRPVSLKALIRTEEFNSMIQDLVDRSLGEVEKAIKIMEEKDRQRRSTRRGKDRIDTVLLVGGSTYVPLVQKAVREYFGKEPNRTVNPDLAVALGAAASLVLAGPEDGDRHVVTVRRLPESTPDETLDFEGHTTAGSKVRVRGGQSQVETVADEEGCYEVAVPLRPGANTLTIESIRNDGKSATLQPEPVMRDESARRVEVFAEAPLPTLSHPLSISCGLYFGEGKHVQDNATIIVAAQSSLPASKTNDRFETSRDNQDELFAEVVEGDLAVASLNAQISPISLQLPPNVPKGERVTVRFTIDENRELTAELECAGRRKQAAINLKNPPNQRHIFQEMEDLLVKVGGRIRPEERAKLEHARQVVEDVNLELLKVKDGSGRDPDAVLRGFERLRAESLKFKSLMEDVKRQYQ